MNEDLEEIEIPADFNPLAQSENAHSNTLLNLNPDQKALATKTILDVRDCLQYLGQSIHNETVTVSNRYTCLGLATAALNRLKETLGGDEDINQDEKRRQMALRSANIEVHRLKDLLGKSVTTEAIAEKLKLLGRTVYEYWQEIGFSYCKYKLNCNWQSLLEVEFTVHLDKHVSTFSETPITEKQQIAAKIAELSKEMDIDNSSSSILDTTKNRKWITNKLRERFPNIRINGWENHCGTNPNDKEVYYIDRMTANIDITDIGDNHKEFKF